VNRRALLTAAAAATATGVAGCLDDGGTGTPDDGTDSTTETPTDAPTETGAETRLVDRSFEVTRVECGDDHGGHDVTTADGTVTVAGTLDGSNGCYTAELVASEYDAAADRLHVEVESVDGSDEGEACTTCVVEIDYVAEFAFENGEPGSVRVDQRGVSTGSSSESGSASASGPDDETATDTDTGTGTTD